MNTNYLMRFIAHHTSTYVRRYDFLFNELDSFHYSSDFSDPLQREPKILHSALSLPKQERPEIISIGQELIYGLVNNGENIFLVGPIRLSGQVFLKYDFDFLPLSDREKAAYPQQKLRTLISYVLLLHNLFTEDTWALDTYFETILSDEDYQHEIQKGYHDIMFQNRERAVTHNSYEQEVREQSSIRTGNVEALRRSWQESYWGELGVLGPTQLRSYQNLAIVLTALASRSAIQGGVHPEIAFSLVDSYCQKIENTTDSSTAGQLGRQAEMQFTTMVKQINDSKSAKLPTFSAKFTQCKDYIFAHLHDNITVAEIAEEVGLHPNYMSVLFKQHEGISISQFILEEKIKEVKYLLTYSEMPILDISNYLGFSSQSYLGTVFKKSTGYTLKGYRNAYAKHK